MRIRKSQRGFNLIELVVVIAVLGALMAGTATYIANSMIAYNDVARRDQLTTQGRITIEKIARALRSALPNSIRIQNNCIEFLPIIGSSVYTSLPTDAQANNFTAVDFSLTTAVGTRYVVVYPYDTVPMQAYSAKLYSGVSPGPRATFGSKSSSPPAEITVTLAANHQFNQHSPQRRFYVVDSPTSYCIEGNNLNRYRGYSINAAQAAPPAATAELIAQDLQLNDSGPVTPFSYTPGTLRRNAIVVMDFRFLIDNEWIRLYHEVQVRNVL